MKYKTIRESVTVKQNIDKSIFIGSVCEVQSIEEAKDFIKRIKAVYRDATHNAFAFRVGLDREDYLCSDDGEPSNTAGLPIYNAIRSSGATNTAVVVTRYFGGIKLGVPGLIQAYGGIAKFALERAQIVEKETYKMFLIKFPYSEIHLVQYFIEKWRVNVTNKDFSEIVTFKLQIEEDAFSKFRESILSKSRLVEFIENL